VDDELVAGEGLIQPAGTIAFGIEEYLLEASGLAAGDHPLADRRAEESVQFRQSDLDSDGISQVPGSKLMELEGAEDFFTRFDLA
jgi:hypothetical protein